MALGAFGLHPLDQIVNVHWLVVADIVIVRSSHGSTPQHFVRFLKIPSPGEPPSGWGNLVEVPTILKPPPPQPFPEFTLSDDRIAASPAIVPYPYIDYRGFSKFAGYNSFVSPPAFTGNDKYFDSKGKTVTSDKIPPLLTDKGKALLSTSDGGVIYVAGPMMVSPFLDGYIAGFDSVGDKVWQHEFVDMSTSVNVDDDKNIVVSNPSDDQGKIKKYDENGAMISLVKDFNSDLGRPVEVSKGGNMYFFYGDNVAFPGIKGFNNKGVQLCDIAPPNPDSDGSWRYTQIIAYKDDYIVVTAQQNFRDSFSFVENVIHEGVFIQTITTIESGTHNHLKIFNAKTGTEVNDFDWGNDHQTAVIYSPSLVQSTIKHDSYGGGMTGYRSNFYPPRPKESE